MRVLVNAPTCVRFVVLQGHLPVARALSRASAHRRGHFGYIWDYRCRLGALVRRARAGTRAAADGSAVAPAGRWGPRGPLGSLRPRGVRGRRMAKDQLRVAGTHFWAHGAGAALPPVPPDFLLWSRARLQSQAPAAAEGGFGAAPPPGADARREVAADGMGWGMRAVHGGRDGWDVGVPLGSRLASPGLYRLRRR